MLDTIAKNATENKTRPTQRTGLERKALQWIRKFPNAWITECDLHFYISDNYRLHKIPAEYVVVLDLKEGVITSTCLNYDRPAIVIDESMRRPDRYAVKNALYASDDSAELVPHVEQLPDGIARFSIADETVLINADYLADAAADGAVRLTGTHRWKPVHAFDSNGFLVAVIMPRPTAS